MRHFKSAFALFVIGVFTAGVGAQGTIEWTSTAYPKPGGSSGAIAVKGKVTIENGWEYQEKKFVVRVWESKKILEIIKSLKQN